MDGQVPYFSMNRCSDSRVIEDRGPAAENVGAGGGRRGAVRVAIRRRSSDG